MGTRDGQNRHGLAATPRASIIIPAFHSGATITGCLQSLHDQTCQDFEVIIVNSSPEEGTRRIVQEQFREALFEQSPTRLLPHAARNVGAKRARGELLVFTDPDCRAHPEWLERLIGAAEEGHPLVCGAIDLAETSWFARGVHLCKYSFRLSGLHPGPCTVAGTANAACTREVWKAVGPFDGERFAGDGLFSWQATASGWQPWFEPRAVVDHQYTHTLGSLWSERLLRGADFAETRIAFERWSRRRTVLYLAAMPALLVLVLARTGKDAVEGNWVWSYFSTLPLQFVGQLAWLIGEARASWRSLTSTRQIGSQ
jgi:glycosyltransferase involved in cell wall biosynthesis